MNAVSVYGGGALFERISESNGPLEGENAPSRLGTAKPAVDSPKDISSSVPAISSSSKFQSLDKIGDPLGVKSGVKGQINVWDMFGDFRRIISL